MSPTAEERCNKKVTGQCTKGKGHVTTCRDHTEYDSGVAHGRASRDAEIELLEHIGLTISMRTFTKEDFDRAWCYSGRPPSTEEIEQARREQMEADCAIAETVRDADVTYAIREAFRQREEGK